MRLANTTIQSERTGGLNPYARRRHSFRAAKAAEDCRTPRPSEVRALNCVAKRLGVRQSSAAFSRGSTAGAFGDRAHAFTLIEVVLAIGIAVGILLVLLFFYQQAADLRTQLISQAERVGAVRLLMDRMTAELRTARPHAFFQAAFIGDSQFLQFIRTDNLPRTAWAGGELGRVTRAQTDLKLVRYSASSRSEGTNVVSSTFERSEEPLVEYRERATANENLAVPEHSRLAEMISEDIRFVRFRYWDGSKWLESWNAPRLPAAVELNVGFEPLAEGAGPEDLPEEVFRRVVYLPGSSAKHPEFTPFKVASGGTQP